MVLSSLQRLLPSFEQVHIEWMGGCKRLVQLLLDECSNDNDTGIMDYSATHRMRRAKEEHWTLEKRGDMDEKIITNEHDNEAKDKAHHLQQQLQQLPIILHQLKTTATTTIPQIISRILHATPPIMHEISRGYFVPFLTVALACLGRIHTLLLRMGRDVVGMLQESVPQLQKVLIIGDDRSNSNSAMKKKSVMQEVVGKDAIMDWKMLYELITPGTFHVETDPKQNTGKGPAASQEWNRLLNHFVETSQVEITKQMNELVKEKRWTDALARFGIGKDTTKSSTPSAEDNIMSGSVEMMHTESALGDDGSDDAEESLLEKRSEEANRDESSSLDMGELVNDTQQPTTTDETMRSSSLGNSVDDNMARIIQREKTKRQNTALASSSMAVKSTTAPKKKRKKKKKKSAGAATSHDGNQVESINTTEAVPADKPSAITSHVEEGLSPNRKKMAEAIQPSSGDGMIDSSAVTKQPSDSASAPLKEQKKKKSSKKKSKKQKRKSSSNAIDDIFGL